MTARLPDHLDLIATAPDGIQKLRGLILELAVRGKLVPQDANDEPAGEFLARVAAARQVIEVSTKTSKRPQLAADTTPPFDVPRGWEWRRLDDLLLISSGITLGKNYQDRTLLSRPYLRVANVQRGYLALDQLKSIEIPVEDLDRYRLRIGDLLITEGGDWDKVGRTAVWSNEIEDCLHQNHVFRARPLSDEWNVRWTEMFLNSASARAYFAGASKQTTNLASINMTQLKACAFPVPPLAEQHRIVAKVDELMALCDRMEAEQADAETAHARIVETLLGPLTQSADADELAANWQCLAEHFDSLFETPSAVAALRKTILNLALDGRLVRQSAPAEMCAISTLIEGDSLNGCSKRPSDTPCGVQILRISAGTGNDDFFVDENDHKWIEVTPAQVEKFRLLPDDLLACRFNGNLHYVGSFSLYRGQSAAPQIFPDKLIRFRVQHHKVLANYLRYALNADSVRVQVEGFCATTVGNIGISAGNLKTVKVRIPELDEQHRIVAKVDELMALCDRLKSDLADARSRQARLADTLIDAALAAA